MFVLDTNVLSELRRPNRSHPAVVAWAGSVPPGAFFLSAVTILEIEVGMLRIERRDPATAGMLREWIEGIVLSGFHGRILSVDLAVALRCAPLHVPNQRSERDALIAATALEYGLTIATRNTADFAGTGVPVLNPWDFKVEATGSR